MASLKVQLQWPLSSEGAGAIACLKRGCTCNGLFFFAKDLFPLRRHAEFLNQLCQDLLDDGTLIVEGISQESPIPLLS